MPEWFYFVDSQEIGPMPWPQLCQAAAAGKLQPETPVRRSDLGWTTAGQIPELRTVIQSAARPAPARAAAPQTVAAARTAAPQAAAPQAAAKPAAPKAAAPQKPLPKAKSVEVVNPKALAAAPGASGIQTKNPAPTAARAKSPIPTGAPVGAPIPAGVPMGAPAASPIGIPVGSANMGLPFPPAPPRSHSDDSIDAPRKKKPEGMMLIIGLGIASVVLGSVFVAILVYSTSKKKKTDPPQNNVAVEEPAAGPAENPEAAENPIAEVKPKPTTPVVATPTVAATPTPKGLPNAFAMQKKYTDLAVIRRVKSSSMKIEVVQMFLAADETGTRVSAAADAEEGKSTVGQFVFVVVEISNSGDKPFTYRSWNHTGEAGALLADDHDTLLKFVSPDQTPQVSRLSAVAEIPPKKMLRDTLVFSAPDHDFDKLRLNLPRTALSVLGGAGYVGFEAPRDLLTAVTAETPAQPTAKPTEAPPGEPEPVDETPPPVVATPPVKPKTNPDGLPTKEEFLKSINDGEDDKKKPKEKEMSPAEREDKMKAEMKKAAGGEG